MRRRSVLALLGAIPAGLLARSALAVPVQQQFFSPRPQWVSGPTLTLSEQNRGGCATGANNALVWGGSVVNESSITANCESSNGTSVSNQNAMVSARIACPSAGTPSDAVSMSGVTNSGGYNKADKYNGSWSASGTISVSTRGGAQAGLSSTAALIAGGWSGAYATRTELFGGTTFSTSGALTTGTENINGCGSQTAAMAAGGDTSVSNVATVQTFGGSAWSSGTALPAAARNAVMNGENSTFALYASGVSYATTTWEWNGASWVTVASMIAGRYLGAGGGSSRSGVAMAGQNSGGGLMNSTEKRQ